MYRFRTVENLIGKHKELENQEIYFATPEELNDPMEGYKDIFWKGDEIVWRNFIKNYTKSVDKIFVLTVLLADEKKLDENDIQVLSHFNSYKTLEHKKLSDKIIERVFSIKFIDDLPKSLAKRTNPVKRNELLSYLQTLHSFIVNSISEVYFENQFISKKFFHQDLTEFSKLQEKAGDLAELTNKLEIDKTKVGTSIEEFFSQANLVFQQIKFLSAYNFADKGVSTNALLLIAEFPEKYLHKLELSIYPDWYSASFLSDCSNSAIWGHYGDCHKGVCLIFKTKKTDEDFEMDLETEYGYSSGPIIGMRPHKFKKINYSNKHIEIDFFRSIGRLNKGQLNAMWYSDGNGNSSECGEHLNKNEDTWRDKYWENYLKSVTLKLNEWSYEGEYRLILHGDFVDYREKQRRKMKYDFNDLEGIIFGMKTSTSDKIKIVKIIEDKCKQNKRKQFDFYQSYYSHGTGKIEKFKLNLLKFE